MSWENEVALLLPGVAKVKIQQKFQISLCKMLKNKQDIVKVMLEKFHLNGHTTAFHPQTQKLEPPWTA